jgi:outer membrane receptor protein involved in Fe transport
MPTERHEFRASYSRRIDRPNTRQINPFVDVSDPLNIRKGNPFLFPEFVDSYELSYTRSWKKTTVASSLYWRERHDVISRFNQVDENGISTFTFINLLTGRSYGFEVVGNFKPYKWWDLNLSGNLFRNVIDGSNVDATLTNEATSYTLKAISTWNLPKDLQFQLSSNYRSPFASAQGTIKAFYSTDIAFSKKVLEGKGSLNFRVSDIFNTLQFSFDSEGANFTQTRVRKRESRIAYLTFSYRFGKADRAMRKQRRERGEGGGGGDFDMD